MPVFDHFHSRDDERKDPLKSAARRITRLIASFKEDALSFDNADKFLRKNLFFHPKNS